MNVITDKMLSEDDVTSNLTELEVLLNSTLQNSTIQEALRAELLIRLGELKRKPNYNFKLKTYFYIQDNNSFTGFAICRGKNF